MIWRKSILVIACFLMLITVASAAQLADTASMSISRDWIVANTVDTTTISVHVGNLSSGEDVGDVPVSFLSGNIVYGNVSPSSGITDGLGLASTTFTANKTSGTVLIHAIVPLSVGGAPIDQEYIGPLHIDHGPAYSSSLSYQPEVIVGETTPFILTLKDGYGNRVDNKNPNQTHKVIFKMYLPPGGMGTGGLKNATSAYLTTISDVTDAAGNITLTAKVDTVPGENNIWISAIENMPDPLYPYITGISQAPPFYIEQVYQPDGTPPALPADQTSQFYILYTLRDQYRNPAGNHGLTIVTSENETIGPLTTNSWGQTGVTYGPKSTSGTITITATAVGNSSVNCSKIVQFYGINPVAMVVTANPQMMPSRDVPTDPPVTGEIIAKVMDVMGNPVEGETVSFTIMGYTNSTTLTKLPSFNSSTYLAVTSATTDLDGNAIVVFYPGEFPVSGPKYSTNATGTAVVMASWAGISMPITVTFKNYPYLRVETSVTPPVVNVSGTFDVDIKLIGDGWKLQSRDIDAFLVFDRSGSMGSDSPTRISQAKTATTTFIDQMNTRDQVGLVSFASSTTTDNTLTNNFASVKNNINLLTASGSTQLRYAIYKAITNLYADGRTGTVKAVIIMTDGNWNQHGTPLGHGTGWPSNNSDYTFSGSDLEPDNYRYYDGLGGTLTSYQSCAVTGCAVYSTTVCDVYGDSCDVCAPGYTRNAQGKCCSGKTCRWPSQNPSWCSVRHCDEWACDVPQTTCVNKVKCTDGEFTEQNMSIYALDKGIRLYTISFASTLDPVAVNGLEVMADSTGGFYQHAPTGADLKNIYLQIAGELRTLAGVNTQMNLSFQNVNVTYNNVTTSMPGKDVFDYIYSEGVSTWVTSWNQSQNPLQVQVPKPPNPDVLPNFGTYTTYPYSFNQRDEWLSTSQLKFNAGNISINQTWETKFRFMVNETGNIDIFGPGSKIIFNNGESELELPHTYVSVVQNLTNLGLNASQLDISNLTWIGSGEITDFIPLVWQVSYTGNQTVTERISYSGDGGLTWVLFDTNYVDKTVTIDYSSLDVRLLPPGVYFIRVDATAPDAPSDRETLMGLGISVGTATRAFIKLE